MLFFMLILLLIVLYGLQFSAAGCFNEHYLDKKDTTAVNGIFVVLIVFSHYAQYADLTGIYDEPYMIMRAHLSQMVVATFLFYSGYGMMEAIKRKGTEYIRRIPIKFIRLLLRFDCAVVLFLLLDMAVGDRYPLADTLLAFTTWTSIGNSNWYITAILMLYICMLISFTITMKVMHGPNGRITGVLLLFVMTAAVVFLQIKGGRPYYCYNTMMVFPLGCLISEAREPLERFIQKNDLRYMLIMLAVLAVYIVSFLHRHDGVILLYTVWAYAFILLIILITMKVRIYNPILEWLGVHVFSIYMLQRIPMIALDHFGCIESHKYISLIVVFAATLPMAVIFDKATGHILTRKAG